MPLKMVIRMRKLINKILEERVCVIFYMTVLLLKVIGSHSEVQVKLIQLLILIFVGVVGVMSLKGNKVAIVIIGILIAITGGATIVVSFLIGGQQIFLKVLFIFIGMYFIIGGAAVFKKGIRSYTVLNK